MFEGIFQPLHLVVILVVLLLLFGPRKLPELGKGLGEGIRGFKDAMRGDGQGQSPSQNPPQAQPQDNKTEAPKSDETKK